jgi:Tfp pilus assembly protein PilO
MSRTKAYPWVLGTVLLSLVVVALAWFLVIAPVLDRAAQSRADAEQARSQNVVQAQRLATLAKQFEELPAFRAELDAIRGRIPTDDGVRELLRQIDAEATGAGLVVLTVAPGLPEEFFPAVPEAAAAPAPAEPTEGTAEETAAAAGAAPAAPAGPTVVDGMVAIPVQITVVGGYDRTVDFVTRLQERLPRLFVVTSLDLKGQEASEGGEGRPPTAEGDVETVIQGYVYTLTETTTVAAPADPAAEAPAEETVTS